jgi:predicted DNA-binding protein with PD1-like motif
MQSSEDRTTINDNQRLDRDIVKVEVETTTTPPIPMRIHSGSLQAHAIRFPPGSDLISSLEYAAKQALLLASSSYEGGGACFILTAVGSLSHCTLRMASAPILPINELQQQQIQTQTQQQHHTTQNLDSQSATSQFDRTTYQQHIRTWNENLEIVSLVGTLGLGVFQNNDNNVNSDTTTISKHLHMSISDAAGNCFGGHLMGGTILTTLELVLGTIGNCVRFDRTFDELTGYQELSVTSPKHNTSRTTT